MVVSIIPGTDGSDLEKIFPKGDSDINLQERNKFSEMVKYQRGGFVEWNCGRYPWQAYIVAANIFEDALARGQSVKIAADDFLVKLCRPFLTDKELPVRTEIVPIFKPENEGEFDMLAELNDRKNITVHRTFDYDPSQYCLICSDRPYQAFFPHRRFKGEISLTHPELGFRFGFYDPDKQFLETIQTFWRTIRERALQASPKERYLSPALNNRVN